MIRVHTVLAVDGRCVDDLVVSINVDPIAGEFDEDNMPDYATMALQEFLQRREINRDYYIALGETMSQDNFFHSGRTVSISSRVGDEAATAMMTLA